jgi:hypothetical protein
VKGAIALAVLRLALKLDLGPEYDSNANRAETITTPGATNVDKPTDSFLVRTTTKLSLSWQSGISLLRVSGGLAGKVFFNPDVADQNTLVGQINLDEQLALGRYVDLGFAGDYYDAGQLDVLPPCAALGCNRHRDFRSGSNALRISLLGEPGDLTLSVGYRGFQYKPDESFDFNAVQATAVGAARLRITRGETIHEIGVTASYHFERRWFSGPREYLSNEVIDNIQCDPSRPYYKCIKPASDSRADYYHEMGLELSYLGPVLFTVGYGLQLNDSNSFAFSLLRHLLTVRLAGRLPWQLYATVKAQLAFASYFDPQILGETQNQTCACLEDENRSAVILDLERPIGKTGVAVEARYSYFTNELGQSGVDFNRHVVYLGVSYKVGWRLGKKRPNEP